MFRFCAEIKGGKAMLVAEDATTASRHSLEPEDSPMWMEFVLLLGGQSFPKRVTAGALCLGLLAGRAPEEMHPLHWQYSH